MSTPTHVFLVPGFFGFTSLAGIEYFAQVRCVLEPALRQRGLDATIVGVKTLPTASLDQRARRLAASIAAVEDRGPIHIVGHSTGGLDARMVGSPGVDLGPELPMDTIRARLASIVTVATPHAGTPLASFFGQLGGAQLLKLLSIAAVHATRVGPIPLSAARLAWRFIQTLDAAAATTLGRDATTSLLADFAPESRQVLTDFFTEVHKDQSLLPQLTPSGAAALTQPWSLPSHVRGGSVVTQARRPSLAGLAELGFDPSAHTLHLVFRWLQAEAGDDAAPPAPGPIERDLEQRFGGPLHRAANDGVVPTRSQSWQTVLDVAWGDHLDVVGHFDGRAETPPHFDWLPSGSRFRRPAFERVWGRIADFIAGG